jgi:hypothetical protein
MGPYRHALFAKDGTKSYPLSQAAGAGDMLGLGWQVDSLDRTDRTDRADRADELQALGNSVAVGDCKEELRAGSRISG